MHGLTRTICDSESNYGKVSEGEKFSANATRKCPTNSITTVQKVSTLKVDIMPNMNS